jgi:glutamine synthetase type III
MFKDKKESPRFLGALENGTTLHVEAGSKVFDFELADYKKPLLRRMT